MTPKNFKKYVVDGYKKKKSLKKLIKKLSDDFSLN